ncbi:zinc finger protein weckle-like [Anastrepha obliqua]|uniref:zinc finger protein weckle-like n=1 Tax=Anastrepha obliqua TaxID=95512 RepID=UPI00240A9507|nr:zinc finger protein weckle-like [Anastrepha obliqua]XP_054744932.1 zinc finger protein weckle-like [Anastrepha obliqua]
MADLRLNEQELCGIGAVDFTAQEWKSWCRLCARADTQYINVISGQCQQLVPKTNEYSSSSCSIAPVIEDFFRIQIKEDEKLSQLVCIECYQLVNSLIRFRERVNKVQQMYDDLQNHVYIGKLNSKALFEKYDLIENAPFFPPNDSKLPVEEIFIADLPVTTISQSSGNDVKSEKKSDEVQTDIFLQEYTKKGEFIDPIGDEKGSSDKDYSPIAHDEDTSDNEDSDIELESKNNESEKVTQKSEDSSNVHNQDLECSYYCKICSQSFQRIRHYTLHMKTRHGDIICPQCPKSFKNALKLRQHMKDHPRTFSCLHCDKKFETKVSLAKHIRCTHEDEQPLICEVCGVTLRTKKQLREHMLQHTDYSPFECKVCGTCFKVKSRLKRHMQIHGDKHICPECGKQLSTRATLKSHLLVHSDKMSHKCDYCGRLFKRANTLKNHLIAHTDLRPYSCDFCDKRFSTGPSCRFHKRTMHPKELAELEASGAKAYTKNIPTLNVLKAVSRAGTNFKPLASKQNGFAHFDKEVQIKPEDVNSNPTKYYKSDLLYVKH